MFDESNDGAKDKGQKGRLAASVLSSVVLYGLLGAAAVAATAAVKNVVVEEKLTQVEFVPPAEPEEPAPPPPPKPKAKLNVPRGPRPKVVRDEMKAPEEIPAEVPDESDAELSEAGDTGPADGYLDGTADGTGNGGRADAVADGDAPEGVRPKVLRTPSKPDYPAEARTARIEGLVLVRCLVGVDGHNKDCRALRGHALLRSTAVAFVAQFQMAPARKPDGTADAVAQIFPVRFEARNL
jgi:protein TonB